MAILQKAFLLNADRPIWLCHFTRIVIQEKGHLSLFTLYTVSYTHLDVYKRQAVYRFDLRKQKTPVPH